MFVTMVLKAINYQEEEEEFTNLFHTYGDTAFKTYFQNNNLYKDKFKKCLYFYDFIW